MTKRQRILAWACALCLIAFAAFAASPSFSNFIAGQFATTGNSVRIKIGATLTNLNINSSAGGPALNVTDTANSGQLGSFFDSSANSVLVMTPTALTLGSSVNLTLLSQTASTVAWLDASKHVSSLANGTGALTNDGSGNLGWSADPAAVLDWPTNALQSSSAFPAAAGGKYSSTNMSAGLTFTGVAGTSTTKDRWGVLLLDANGADRTLTLPASWLVSDGVRTITVTNGVIGVLSVNVFGNWKTQAVYRPFY